MCQTTRGYIGCFISDILSIGRFRQPHHANFNCFNCLGTARVHAYIYPIAPHLGGVQCRPRPCQHLRVRVKGGINLDEVLSFIMSEQAQRGMGERDVDAGGATMVARGTRTTRRWRKRIPCSVHPHSISGHSMHTYMTVMSPLAPCGVVPSPPSLLNP